MTRLVLLIYVMCVHCVQVVGILVIFGWVCAMMIPFFSIFKFFGMLRISTEEEQAGLDVSKHGGSGA